MVDRVRSCCSKPSTRGNLIVQPRNLGTGIGILYSLLHILAKDSQAQVVLLPADHYVRDEDVLNSALLQALERLDRNADRPVLLGLQPDEPDTDLGYILPGDPDPFGGHTVARFIEKPGYSVAREIIDAGGLWNTFIMVAAGAHAARPVHAALRAAGDGDAGRASRRARPRARRPAAGRRSSACTTAYPSSISRAICSKAAPPTCACCACRRAAGATWARRAASVRSCSGWHGSDAADRTAVAMAVPRTSTSPLSTLTS